MEIKYSTLQFAKLLKVLKYKTFDEFTDLKRISNLSTKSSVHGVSNIYINNPAKQFNQDSCVFSYYILKGYILNNIASYFELCLDDKLQFNKSDTGFTNLMKIFNDARHNIHLINIINILLKKIPSYQKQSGNHSKTSKTSKITKAEKSNIKESIYKTLRMTCLDLHR